MHSVQGLASGLVNKVIQSTRVLKVGTIDAKTYELYVETDD